MDFRFPISLCCFFLVAVTPLLSPAPAMSEEIAVGVILPLSGTNAAYGHMQKNSMLMAVEEVNSRGGINGGSLLLDIRDSGGRSRNARVLVDHFVKDKQYPVVLGGFSSKVAASLAEKCEQRLIPLVVITGSEDAITLQDNRYVFRVAPPRSMYPGAALDYAKARFKDAGIALVTERSSYGDSMTGILKQAARESGWVITGDWKFSAGSRNLQVLFSDVVASAPEVVFLTAFPPDGTRIIMELRERIPETAIFNMTPASTSAGSYEQCGDGCSGVMNPSLWQPRLTRSGSRYFDRYTDRFEMQPDYHGAQAYAAVIAAAKAIERAGVPLPGPVRDALEGLAVNTPYGRVSFRAWGGYLNQNNPANYLLQWNGTGFEVVWPERP